MSRAGPIEFKGYSITVSNIEKALEYYSGYLGLEVVWNRSGKFASDGFLDVNEVDFKLVSLRLLLSDARLELLEVKAMEGVQCEELSNANPGTSHICWYVNDLCESWAQLESKGVRLVSESVVDVPTGPMEGGRAVYLKDFDNARVELLEGEVYLDLSRRSVPVLAGNGHQATEFSHVGVHVSSLNDSLPFYRDVLGLDLVAEWLIDEDYVRRVVGYKSATLNMALFRFPGTSSFLEVIEYQGVSRKKIKNGMLTPGTCKLIFEVECVNSFLSHMRSLNLRGEEFLEGIRGDKSVFLKDPDGILVEIVEKKQK